MKKWILSTLLTAAVIVAGASYLLSGEQVPSAASPGAALTTGTTVADGSSRCGSPGGKGCCSASSGQAAAGERVEQIRAYLTDYYARTVGGEISVEVRDLGCHQEADVKQAGQTIKRLSISGNSISEIS